jgi:hypothetical protein
MHFKGILLILVGTVQNSQIDCAARVCLLKQLLHTVTTGLAPRHENV